MIIKKLQLHNFGVYAGDNEFAFEGNKPIVLIGGMNGRGKRLFWKPFYWRYMVKTLLRTPKCAQIVFRIFKIFCNRGASDDTCSVTLEFETNNGICENYKDPKGHGAPQASG